MARRLYENLPNGGRGHEGRQRGLTAEERCEELVRLLRARLPGVILDVRRATGEEDRNGADVVVTTSVGEVKIQVKASFSGRTAALEAGKTRYPIFVATERRTTRELLGELTRLIRREVA